MTERDRPLSAGLPGANAPHLLNLNKIFDEWARPREGRRWPIRRAIRERNLEQLREQIRQAGLEENVAIAPVRLLDEVFNR